MRMIVMHLSFFVTLAVAALITGFLFGLLLVELALYNLTGPQFVATQQVMDRQISAVMPGVMVLAIVAGAGLFVSIRYEPYTWSRALVVLGTVCSVLIMASTAINNAPINQMIQTWTAEAPPSNWATIRDTWVTWHIVRTIISGIGLSSHLLALILLIRPSLGTVSKEVGIASMTRERHV